MVRKVDGPEITGQVVHKQTGQAYGPVAVTVSPKVYTDPEMTASVTSLTTDGTGVFSCYAPPGQYTFTTTAVDSGPIEPVEVLGREGGTGGVGTAASSAPVQSTQTGTTYTLALSDANTTVRCTNAGAVTLTVPPSASAAWVAGTIISVRALGAAGVTVAAGAGVTIQNNTSALVQYQEVSLAYDATDSWIRVG